MSKYYIRSIVQPLLMLLAIQQGSGQKCEQVQTIDFTTSKIFSMQPCFFNVLEMNEQTVLLDNVCMTIFPLPDDPDSFIFYLSNVYCDGSNDVTSFICTSSGKGQFICANSMETTQFSVFGYAGCDTFLVYACSQFSVSGAAPPNVFGSSPNCAPIGLSCLRKLEEIISNAGLPKKDLYILPMKLPNRCVTQQLCTIPPNPFYNKLGPSVGLVY